MIRTVEAVVDPSGNVRLGSGSLHSDSYARPSKLFTASQELMVARVATLSPGALEQLIEAVVRILRRADPP
jgi:hypothetical protein